ncbi:MAG: hypothetical protein WC332_03010 [Clostridia bacterium]|jgi:hypothetical protein
MIVIDQGDYIQAKLSAAVSGGIKSVTLNEGGTGYTEGTVTLTVVQSGGASGTLSATASASGVITAINSISAYGTGYAVETGLSTTAAGGSGCTVNIDTIYQPAYTCSYIDTDDVPGQTSGFLNGTTAVTILFSPATGQRMLDLGIIFNSDKASVTPIIELVSGGTTIEIHSRETLIANQHLEFGRQGSVTSISDNSITLAKLATQAAETVLVNATSSTAVPTALALSEQTVLGRITGGHIVGLSVSQLITLITSASLGNITTGNIVPVADNTHYIGKNDDDTPFAYKGVILKDTTNGKYYRIEIINGTITATDLTD